jgi:hypothetical protein
VFKWGADIQTVVTDNLQLTRRLSTLYQVTTSTPQQALKLPPHSPWHGILFATIRTLQDRELIQSIFDAWLPADAILAIHGRFSRRELMQVTPSHSSRYQVKISKARHSQFGGATVLAWSLIHLSRFNTPINVTSLMTKEHYPQPLQASLDDTLGLSQEKFSFEPCSGQDYIGMVTLRRTGTKLPVYDADGLAPDLSAIRSSRFWFFWVRAFSVWSKTKKVLRPVQLHELFAICDFEGKLACKGKTRRQILTLLQHRLYSPPGKLARLVHSPPQI